MAKALNAVSPELIRPAEVKKRTGRSLSALAKDRMLRKGIPFIKIGRSVMYDPRDVDEFLQQNRRHCE